MQTDKAGARIYFTGVGGQGTLTATKLLAQAALDAGIEAVGGEVHGMAQRGGVVESALLLGGWLSPRIDFGEADIILGFEALETLRGLDYLRSGGYVFSSVQELPPLSASLGHEKYPSLDFIKAEVMKIASRSWFLPCKEIGQEAGAIPSGNTALLAALCASKLIAVTVEDLRAAIVRHLSGKAQKSNLMALELGAKWMAENAA